MKYIVTGGRGFIGSHFVEEVIRRGDVRTMQASNQTGP